VLPVQVHGDEQLAHAQVLPVQVLQVLLEVQLEVLADAEVLGPLLAAPAAAEVG
jgi:hypothetical protein